MIDNAYFHQLRLKLMDFIYKEIEEASIEEVKDDIKSFYNVYNNIVANLGNCIIYRVRKIDVGDNHTIAKDVWCPEPQYVTSRGRANDKEETVFYGALDPLTAITETKVGSGDRFSLASYRLAPLEDNIQSSIVIKEVNEVINNPTEFDLFGIELSKFMVKEFTKDVELGQENQYIKTCAIAKILMELPNKDSIIYPSVRNDDAINIVMKEAMASERLTLESVMTCKMETTDTEQKIIISEIKKLSHDGNSLQNETHEYLPFPLNIEENYMNFSNLFHNDNVPSREEIFNQRMQEARDSVV